MKMKPFEKNQLTDYWKKYLKREVRKGENENYILRRINRYISSGCANCWDICNSSNQCYGNKP